MVADMVANMEVDKVADMVADIAADKKQQQVDVCTKTKSMYAQKRSRYMHDNKVDVCTKTKTKCIGPKLFDAKCTQLACLLSFASLFFAQRVKRLSGR